MSKTVEEILNNYYDERFMVEVPFSEAQSNATEAINQLLIEAKIEELEKIEDCFGNISQVSLSGKRNYNLNLRIKELQSTLKNTTEKEQ